MFNSRAGIMQFQEIPGHQSLKEQFIRQVDSGEIPHAILLMGHEGSEVLPFALALSQYFLCENKTATGSCGECSSCKKVEKHIHPDVHFTYPVVPKKSGDKPVSTDYIEEWRKALSKNPFMNYYQWMDSIGAENRQGNITAEECNEILRGLNLKAFEGAYKIQLIWLPEFLGNNGNRLLKVLEEPTDKTLFILASEDEERILNTILSRCQIFKMPALDVEELSRFLQEKRNVPKEEAEKTARIAGGSMNAACMILDDEEGVNERWCLEWFRICFGMFTSRRADSTAALMPFIESLAAEGREKQKNFLKYALYMLRESLQLKYIGRCRLSESEIPFAKHISEKMSILQIQEMSRIIEKLHYHVERNANPKITFFHQSIQMAKVIAGMVTAS